MSPIVCLKPVSLFQRSRRLSTPPSSRPDAERQPGVHVSQILCVAILRQPLLRRTFETHRPGTSQRAGCWSETSHMWSISSRNFGHAGDWPFQTTGPGSSDTRRSGSFPSASVTPVASTRVFTLGQRSDPEHRSYRSFASFSDPDGNGWLFQELTPRLPGRIDATATSFASASDLASAFRRAEAAHGEHEKRTGQRDANWPDWYAA